MYQPNFVTKFNTVFNDEEKKIIKDYISGILDPDGIVENWVMKTGAVITTESVVMYFNHIPKSIKNKYSTISNCFKINFLLFKQYGYYELKDELLKNRGYIYPNEKSTIFETKYGGKGFDDGSINYLNRAWVVGNRHIARTRYINDDIDILRTGTSDGDIKEICQFFNIYLKSVEKELNIKILK